RRTGRHYLSDLGGLKPGVERGRFPSAVAELHCGHRSRRVVGEMLCIVPNARLRTAARPRPRSPVQTLRTLHDRKIAITSQNVLHPPPARINLITEARDATSSHISGS